MSPQDRLPDLVDRWNAGEAGALNQLVELLYDELRALAHRHLQTERPGHTLSTTALVHEVYVELSSRTGASWRGRPQLFALTSRIMRSVLVDHARRRGADKRGGNLILVPLDDADPGVETELFELLSIDEALDQLADRDEQLARIVEYRFFGGMTSEDIAGLLDISTRSVRRRWSLARAFLFTFLAAEGETRESRA